LYISARAASREVNLYSVVEHGTLDEISTNAPQPNRANVLVMPECARLETATLGQVDDTYYYGASCSSCHRSKRQSLVRLRSVLGDACPLVDLRKRLKCSTCGRKQLTIMFLAPNQGGTSLQHLFQRPVV
jgi:hypothetical protein